jgi:hypothetical protein
MMGYRLDAREKSVKPAVVRGQEGNGPFLKPRPSNRRLQWRKKEGPTLLIVALPSVLVSLIWRDRATLAGAFAC